MIYLVLVALACVATLLGLLPVVQHRKRPERDPDQRLVARGARILIALLVIVTLLAIGVAVFLFDVVLGGAVALVVGVVAVLAGVLVWVLPARARAAGVSRLSGVGDASVRADDGS